MAIMAAFLFTFPLLLQLSFESTAIESGLALLPFSITTLVAAVLGSRLSARYTAKRLIQIGYVIAVPGLGTLAAPIRAVSYSHLPLPTHQLV